MEVPKAAVIYLTYHGADSYADITRCFKTLQAMDYPRDRVEIICVENPSPHGASWPFIEKEWMPLAGVSFPRLTIHKNEKDLGYAGANNVGVGIAREHGCVYAFLLNQDADVHPCFLKEAIRRAESDPQIMFVQSLLLLGQDKNRVNSVGNRITFLGHGYAGGYQWTVGQAMKFFDEERVRNPDLEVPYFTGASVLVRLAMAEKIGLFDASFYMYHEDVDASWNARTHGWKTVVEPASVVYHYYAFSRSIKKFYWMERNRLLVLLSYYKLGTWLLIAVPFLGVELISLVFALKSGWWREKLRSWGFFFKPSAWKWVCERRRRIQCERVIGDRVLLAWVESRILFQESSAAGKDQEIARDAGSFIMTKIANPLLTAVWRVVYFLIRW